VNNIPALGSAVLVPAFDNPNTSDTVPSLPPARVDAAMSADAIPAGGDVTVQAALYDIAGNPLPAGVTVNFAIVNGGGSLSSATAMTDASGVAQVTYTAPGSSEVAVIRASIQSPGGQIYSGSATVFVGYQSDVTQIVTVETDIGPEFVSLPGLVDVLKQGNGTPVVTLAMLDNVPNAGNIYSPYVDVHLSSSSDVISLTITLTYTDETNEAAHALYYYTGGIWEQVSDSSVDTAGNTVSFTASAASTPALSDLSGTPFVVGNINDDIPTALAVRHLSAHSIRWSGVLVIAALAVLAAVFSGLWLLRRRQM